MELNQLSFFLTNPRTSPSPYDLKFAQKYLQDRIDSNPEDPRAFQQEYQLLARVAQLREKLALQPPRPTRYKFQADPQAMRVARANDLLKDYDGPEEMRERLMDKLLKEEKKQEEPLLVAPTPVLQKVSSEQTVSYLKRKKRQLDDTQIFLEEIRQRGKGGEQSQARLKADREAAEEGLLEGVKNLKLHARGIRDHLEEDEGRVDELGKQQDKSKEVIDRENSRLKAFANRKGIGLIERILTIICAAACFFLGMNLIFWFPMRVYSS